MLAKGAPGRQPADPPSPHNLFNVWCVIYMMPYMIPEISVIVTAKSTCRSLIHPSTKSPLAGAAWNFSQPQVQQLCGAVLVVATSGKLRETWKGMHWKVFVENEVMDVRSAFARVNLRVRYLPEGSDRCSDLKNVHRARRVIRLYRSCHMVASPACTAQFCNRCAVH